MENEVVEVLDVGLTDRVVRRRGWEVEQDDRVVSREQYQEHPIPEEYMAALEGHIGDAGAKVTVGAELGNSKEYNGAKAFVSVSATCNNNEEDFVAVHNIIHALARKLVNEDLEKMRVDRDAHVAQEPQGKVSAPPRASAKPPAKPAPAATKPGVQRPSFRR